MSLGGGGVRGDHHEKTKRRIGVREKGWGKKDSRGFHLLSARKLKEKKKRRRLSRDSGLSWKDGFQKGRPKNT